MRVEITEHGKHIPFNTRHVEEFSNLFDLFNWMVYNIIDKHGNIINNNTYMIRVLIYTYNNNIKTTFAFYDPDY